MIDFSLSENDQRTLAAAREKALIARKYARHYEENEHEFPPDELPEAADFVSQVPAPGAPSPEDSNGPVISMLAVMANNWGDYSVQLRRGRGGLGNAALSAAGTPEQKQRWAREILSMAITEPGCGSDPSRLQCSAVLDEASDEWVLNGEKIFVTTGCRATGVVVWATVDKAAGRAGIKSFVVMKGTPGFDVTHKEKKLGIRADDTAAYVFRDCRIPRDHLLGLDESVKQKGSEASRVMKTFNLTRPATAAMGLGIAEAALDFTREQLQEAGLEIAYGVSEGRQPEAVAKFLELEGLFEASRLALLRAAWLAGEGLPNNLESSVCKAHAGTAVRLITQGCIEILGPMGISREHLLEKWLRDCRITDIYEGTGEIQRLIIARGLLDYTREELKEVRWFDPAELCSPGRPCRGGPLEDRAMAIEEGKKAPAFTLRDADGNEVALKDFQGTDVILYFYPRDDTPGCTKQACGFRDLWKPLQKQGAVVLGVSPDGPEAHEKFIAKYKLPFTLLCDPERKVMEKYGAFGDKMMYGKKTRGVIRSTVWIGPDGKVKKHWARVASAEKHPAKVLEALQEG